MKYNLGCGKLKKGDFINVDKRAEVSPDIVADVTIVPWKWASENQADLIFSDNLFEHIEAYPLIKVVQECHRVLKPGGILHLRLPLTAPDNLMTAFSDPTHVSYFTMETFDWYDYKHPRWDKYGSLYGIPKFKRVEQKRQDRFLIVKLKVVK